MGTRSAIIQKLPDGTYRGIYCHWNGSLDANGAKLLTHYSDPEKVASLTALGDISRLGERVEPIGAHSYERKEKGTTVAYGRDRGETHVSPTLGATAQAVADRIDNAGRIYLYEDGAWTYNGRPLAEAVAEDQERRAP